MAYIVCFCAFFFVFVYRFFSLVFQYFAICEKHKLLQLYYQHIDCGAVPIPLSFFLSFIPHSYRENSKLTLFTFTELPTLTATHETLSQHNTQLKEIQTTLTKTQKIRQLQKFHAEEVIRLQKRSGVVDSVNGLVEEIKGVNLNTNTNTNTRSVEELDARIKSSKESERVGQARLERLTKRK